MARVWLLATLLALALPALPPLVNLILDAQTDDADQPPPPDNGTDRSAALDPLG